MAFPGVYTLLLAAAQLMSAASSASIPTQEYDYIVVGGGAGGIPTADKLSASGKSVLLIERGPPSTGRWHGNNKPKWLEGTELTRYDVPGLYGRIWSDSEGIACPDYNITAGCVLGGGTAVNAGLWWKPNPADWDFNFPQGWKSHDMEAATQRVFSRIPGTTTTSKDGKMYLQSAANVLSRAFKKGNWTEVDGNKEPQKKRRTYTKAPFMFADGERNGPLATYLVTAVARPNFQLLTNVNVARVVRTGSYVLGVEIEGEGNGGANGIIRVKRGGKVVLSAGAFGTPKILFRSGIGPQDQLRIVKSSSDSAKLIAEDQWINLPVGQNLGDHTNVDTTFTHSSIVGYDYNSAYENPLEADKNLYLQSRSGPLAQADPSFGPIAFDEIDGKDGVKRQIQWTARVAPNHETIIALNLGRGMSSKGRLSINSDLRLSVKTVPYLAHEEDIQAIVKAIQNLKLALSREPGLEMKSPAKDVVLDEWVRKLSTRRERGANHWVGSAKIGPDDGRHNGTSVVDLNTKVYGTDNLFVVDASIFPGIGSANPSCSIVVAAEHAAEKILRA